MISKLIPMKHLKFLTLLVILGTSDCFAQQKTVDSLLSVIKTAKEDTNKVVSLNELSWEYLNLSASNKADSVSKIALKLSQNLDYKRGIARSYKNIGYAYEDKGNYMEALKSQLEFLRIESEIGERNGISAANNNIGNIYTHLGNYSEALKSYQSSLKIKLEINDKRGIANGYNNIGNIYFFQGNYPEALKNYLLGLKIRQESGDELGVAESHINIGSIYSTIGNYPDALKSYQISMEINNKFGKIQNVGLCYSSMGDLYRLQGKYSEAYTNATLGLHTFEQIGDKYNSASCLFTMGYIDFDRKNFNGAMQSFKSSLKIRKEIGDKEGIANCLLKLGQIAIKLNKVGDAQDNLLQAMRLSKEMGHKEHIKDCYFGLTALDSMKSNWKDAYNHHKQYTLYRDSLKNEEATKKIVQSQMQFEFDKKESLAKAEQDKKDALVKKEKEKQKIITYSVGVGFLLVLALAIFIFRGYRQKQKANILLEDKNKIIEEKNNDITDSINYALRIQNAMLPSKEEISKSLPQSFILFKPKAIVSGDFYFFQKNDQDVIIAAADCTGHGVPGALMSMIGSAKLNDAVSLTSDTSKILEHLNKGIKTSLRQSDSKESTRDGMDIALCLLDIQNRVVKYSGANRPIWVIRNGSGEIEEIKSTKRAIGGLTSENQGFESHEVQLNQGDTFYIFSDGYGDTFGGLYYKKLTSKKFSQILLEIQHLPMPEQEKHLDEFIEHWKAGTDQVDDILVIGVRV